MWWSRPRCPCDPEAKSWIERRLAWLSEQFDDSAFSGLPVVLPTRDFFPDPFDGSKASVKAMLNRVCRYMDVDADRVVLRLKAATGQVDLVDRTGLQLPGAAAGTYHQVGENFVITLNRDELVSPMNLVGTMAHELAHARLMGEGRVDPDIYDNELLTDLTTVFMGLGIFLANSPRAYQSQMSDWPDSNLKRPEYMSLPMYSYALAHLAWFREERKPSWARHLNFHLRPEFKQAQRFLWETRESAFRPGAA